MPVAGFAPFRVNRIVPRWNDLISMSGLSAGFNGRGGNAHRETLALREVNDWIARFPPGANASGS